MQERVISRAACVALSRNRVNNSLAWVLPTMLWLTPAIAIRVPCINITGCPPVMANLSNYITGYSQEGLMASRATILKVLQSTDNLLNHHAVKPDRP